MNFKTTVIAAAAAIVTGGTAATAATYDALSHYEGGSPEHSVWFAQGPNGASGSKSNHFLFENTVGDESPHGQFNVNGNKASLSGVVRNAALQGFRLDVDLVEVADPGAYKITSGATTAGWKFYDFVSATLTSLTPGIKSFDLEMRGAGLKVQLGVGANDKDANLFGLSTWFTAREQGCDAQVSRCQYYNGDINIVLEEGDPNVVPLPASVLLLPAALGMLGAGGGLARRRRKS